jgi:preprotein translocase subunit SecA
MLKIPEDMPIESKMVSSSIEKSQQRVEGHHFDTRKHLIEYDDVINKHREVVYARRHEVLEAPVTPEADVLKRQILELVEGEVEQVVLFHTGEMGVVPTATGEQTVKKGDWNVKEIVETLRTIVPVSPAQEAKMLELTVSASNDKLHAAEQRTKLIEAAMEGVKEAYGFVETSFADKAQLRQLERSVMLRAMDTLWIDHLSAVSALRHGIGLVGYGQRDPLVEYKKEAFQMFQRLLSAINQEVAYGFFKYAFHAVGAMRAQQTRQAVPQDVDIKPIAEAPGVQLQGAGTENVSVTVETPAQKEITNQDVGRNDPCPCGSGKKYKKCHGA